MIEPPYDAVPTVQTVTDASQGLMYAWERFTSEIRDGYARATEWGELASSDQTDWLAPLLAAVVPRLSGRRNRNLVKTTEALFVRSVQEACRNTPVDDEGHIDQIDAATRRAKRYLAFAKAFANAPNAIDCLVHRSRMDVRMGHAWTQRDDPPKMSPDFRAQYDQSFADETPKGFLPTATLDKVFLHVYVPLAMAYYDAYIWDAKWRSFVVDTRVEWFYDVLSNKPRMLLAMRQSGHIYDWIAEKKADTSKDNTEFALYLDDPEMQAAAAVALNAPSAQAAVTTLQHILHDLTKRPVPASLRAKVVAAVRTTLRPPTEEEAEAERELATKVATEASVEAMRIGGIHMGNQEVWDLVEQIASFVWDPERALHQADKRAFADAFGEYQARKHRRRAEDALLDAPGPGAMSVMRRRPTTTGSAHRSVVDEVFARHEAAARMARLRV